MSDFRLSREDGRTLACRRLGAGEGPLVVYLHGAPSSRRDVDWVDSRAAERGVRLVSFDRPGYGGSDYADYDFSTVASDVAAVADDAGADQFHVIGLSAGAPYALATAALQPVRVISVCATGGNAPFAPEHPWWDHLSEDEHRGVQLIGIDDAEASRILAEADRPFMDALDEDDAGLLAFWRNICAPPDQRMLDSGFGRLLVTTVRESLRQGQRGWARDNVVRMGQWSFDLAEVRCPALVWYGDADDWRPGEWLVERLPHGTLRRVPGQGHFSVFESWDDVLDGLGV